MVVFAGVVVLVLAILGAAWISSCPIDPVYLNLGHRPKAEGFWSHQFDLANMEKLPVGRGPEDMAVDSQGWIYTGTGDGWIKRVGVDGKIENHAYVGGRPLGVALGPSEEIYVAEPAQGLLKISNDRVVHRLSDSVDGKRFVFADGVVVAKDGTVYFTEASSKFGLEDFMSAIWEARPNGRVLKYDPSTNSTTIFLKDFVFANGIALSENEDFLLIAETGRVRVMRYWLNGDKEGTLEVFLTNLLGYPDNIHLRDGNFYIGLNGERTMAIDWAMRTPSIRCFLTHPFVQSLLVPDSMPAKLIVVSPEGKLLKKYEDPTGKMIGSLTGGMKVGDFVYFNALFTDFLGRIKL